MGFSLALFMRVGFIDADVVDQHFGRECFYTFWLACTCPVGGFDGEQQEAFCGAGVELVGGDVPRFFAVDIEGVAFGGAVEGEGMELAVVDAAMLYST